MLSALLYALNAPLWAQQPANAVIGDDNGEDDTIDVIAYFCKNDTWPIAKTGDFFDGEYDTEAEALAL